MQKNVDFVYSAKGKLLPITIPLPPGSDWELGECSVRLYTTSDAGNRLLQLDDGTVQYASGAVQTASETIDHLWSVGLTSAVQADNNHLMNLAAPIQIASDGSLVLEIATPVDADGDTADVYMEFKRTTIEE